ncbi:MAG TPA: thiamine pyrophosphate-dependent enzyme [Candidatus Dormibacteraeota bacterium]|jgi:pyruvate dehydrogenase E1 component alpha subunit|nr:thiamine pyrophosphate-dependent enzyme [Candidatus Dormibacteraeota bacterium]
MRDVVMPAVGMAMTEGVLVRWLRRPGESVEEQGPIAEIETDKAIVQLESPVAGVMGELLAAEGDVVPVGEVLARIEEGATATTPSAGNGAPHAEEIIQTPSPEIGSGRGPVHGAGLEATTGPVDLEGIAPSHALAWLERMLLIRRFEEACERLVLENKIPGGVHSAKGQEGVAVGVISALAPNDIVTSSHRSHHHALAKGLPPDRTMAELYGRATGVLGGRAGHMHLADFDIGLYGSNGIVGGGLGIAMGASLGAHLRGSDQVAVGFFGDGGSNTGRVWEFTNLASMWHLPLIIVCENNLYAVETYVGRSMAGESIADRAAGFGLPAHRVDGQDVAAMHRAVTTARARARAGEGPSFIEALTYRYGPHGVGEQDPYRTREEVDTWRRTRDPIDRLRQALAQRGDLDDGRFEEMDRRVRDQVEQAIEFAGNSPWPDPATATQGVTGLVGRWQS